MEAYALKGKCSPLPLSALRLLVPPIRLVSAAIWQTIQQKAVADYGMLEEFVFIVTDIVPELLTTHQRAQLILGLRARLILELCQVEATADLELLQPHLDRVQMLMEAWPVEVSTANTEVPHSEFVDLIKNLLKNPEEREHFFQNVFPEDFGPTYDEELHTLMWKFLSRLEKFLPLHTFQQVASMFGEVSSVLEVCMDSVSQRDELRTLLQYQKDLKQLDHNDDSSDGACIVSALKLPIVERTETDKTQPCGDELNKMSPCASDLDNNPSTSPHTVQIHTDTITEDQTSQMKIDESNRTPGENEAAVLSGDVTECEQNVGLLESQMEDEPRCLKQCHIQLNRLNVPQPLESRPVRQNRGLRMKKILLEEKRGLREEAIPAYKSSRKTKPSSRVPPAGSDDEDLTSIKHSYMAPIDGSSENDSWSYYSETGVTNSNPSMADSWSNYSDEESFVRPVRSNTDDDSSSSCSDEDPSVTNPDKLKVRVPKKTRSFQCYICKEQVQKSLRAHMKAHFPTGVYACPRCDSRFKLFSSFKLHLNRTCFEHVQQQVDPEKPDEAKDLNKCDECEKAFKQKVSLEKHKLTHNELYCKVCRKVLRDAATLARHKASHTLFRCSRCEVSFSLFKPLLRHYENTHQISGPYKCNHCPKTLSKLRLLIAHEWKHKGYLPFQCAQCGLRFRTDADLISHERVHTKERPYLCAECGKTFSQKSNLLRHLNLIHSESRDEKKHSCSECDKSFKEKGALKKHQRTKHLNELFRHQCPYCGKMVSTSTIARHKLIHTGEKPYKCTVAGCDKDFRSTSELNKHVLMHHTTERPYKCDVCGKGFIKMCLLNEHSKIHLGVKPFVCHICGKAFSKLYSMRRHKKLVHSFVTQ